MFSLILYSQTSVPPFTPSPTECQSTGLVSNSPVLSGSYSSGISSLSRCSVSEASGPENTPTDHALPNSASSGSDELIRRENKTPPPYSIHERNNLRRQVPLPPSLSIPPSIDAPTYSSQTAPDSKAKHWAAPARPVSQTPTHSQESLTALTQRPSLQPHRLHFLHLTSLALRLQTPNLDLMYKIDSGLFLLYIYLEWERGIQGYDCILCTF